MNFERETVQPGAASVHSESGRTAGPLGIAALEDKILQGALCEVLNAIYETDFLGFSYGFRPARNQHQALDAIVVGIRCSKVNWVLDADVRGFFDTINHEWMLKFLQHRIGDQRVIRLIGKWLKAGIMEQGEWKASEEGTPQGATISPLLANVYMHYVFDLWIEQWRKRQARGKVIVVRYADDFIVGFQNCTDAEQFRVELKERLAKFALSLSEEKTRLSSLVDMPTSVSRSIIEAHGGRLWATANVPKGALFQFTLPIGNE